MMPLGLTLCYFAICGVNADNIVYTVQPVTLFFLPRDALQ